MDRPEPKGDYKVDEETYREIFDEMLNIIATVSYGKDVTHCTFGRTRYEGHDKNESVDSRSLTIETCVLIAELVYLRSELEEQREACDAAGADPELCDYIKWLQEKDVDVYEATVKATMRDAEVDRMFAEDVAERCLENPITMLVLALNFKGLKPKSPTVADNPPTRPMFNKPKNRRAS